MHNARNNGRIILLILLLSLASCGGQGSGPGIAPSTNSSDVSLRASNTTAPAPSRVDLDIQSWLPGQDARRSGELEGSTDLLPGNLQGIGAMPSGDAEMLGNGQKITSAIQELDPTVVYDDSGDITINVNSVSFTPGAGVLSWAMYQLSLPDDGYPLSVRMTIDNISGGGGPGQGYYILVSNYTTGRWLMSELYTTSGIKTVNLPTTDGVTPQNYLSPLGNFYVALLAYDDVQVELGGFSQDTNTRPQALIVETNNIYVRSTSDSFQFRNQSEDSDNSIARVSWDFNGDDIEDSDVILVNHVYDTPGVHSVELTVWDQNGGWDVDTMYVYTFDTADNALPDKFMEALNEGDPDPLPPPDIPLPELGFDETFEWFFDETNSEWWEIPDTTDNASWKTFNDFDVPNNTPYADMRCWMPDFGSYYYDNHVAALPFSNAVGRTAGNWADMQGIVQTGAWLHGVGVVNEGIFIEVEDNDPLATAIKRLMNEYPVELPNEDPTFAQIQAEVADVPEDFQRALGRLVNAIRQAKPYHEEFLDPANTLIFGLDPPAPPPEGWQQSTFDNSLGMVVTHENGGPIIAYAQNGLIPLNFGYEELFQGGALLAAAIDDFREFLNGWSYAGPSFEFDLRTSLGNIRVTGDGNDVIDLPDWDAGTDNGWYLLQVDTGGDDDYQCHAGGNASLDNPIAICIDWKGDDNYLRLDDPDDVDRSVLPSNDNTHQQGSGRMGYGFLLDMQGNDEYQSVRLSQGCSNFGVGILWDLSGTDSYEAEAMSQGASLVGIGVLFDTDGADSYSSTAYSQGFGSFRGVGILSDLGFANDSYYAEPAYSATRPEYNSGDDINNNNFCQGSALGRQPSGDATIDPYVGSGGLGLLTDEDGNDTYTAGNFAQAAAYMEGTGLLLDYSGADDYMGVSNCGSFSARRAVSLLWDHNGADGYFYTGEFNIAAASIYSVAWLLDSMGADTYESDATCMAAALRNSFCYLVDYNGADTYEIFTGPMRPCLGSAYIGETDPNGLDATPTLGLLVDVEGGDTYTLPEAVLDRDGNVLTVDNNSVWVRSKHTELEPGWHDYEYGVGADGDW